MISEADFSRAIKLTLVIPCFNEERTLEKCVKSVLRIGSPTLSLEIILVDDGSTDKSLLVAQSLAAQNPEIIILKHDGNQGKGAALRTGFQHATGDFVAVQDADLEYNPSDLRRLLVPLVNDEADVVFGSRFLTAGTHRVLYFWHYLGNKFLTLLSNMFSDLNLTDMETCYKVFRREIIQNITIQENRFGVEPELVAKAAQMRVRIFEAGISYYGRTYQEGKKIGIMDGVRALYCIFHYNAPKAPLPMQFLIYTFIGGVSAVFNILLFLALLLLTPSQSLAIWGSYILAAVVNYLLCIALLFRHKARWSSAVEILTYFFVVCIGGLADFWTTKWLLIMNATPWIAKSISCMVVFVLNFFGRRYFVFPEPPAGPWKPQIDILKEK